MELATLDFLAVAHYGQTLRRLVMAKYRTIKAFIAATGASADTVYRHFDLAEPGNSHWGTYKDFAAALGLSVEQFDSEWKGEGHAIGRRPSEVEPEEEVTGPGWRAHSIRRDAEGGLSFTHSLMMPSGNEFSVQIQFTAAELSELEKDPRLKIHDPFELVAQAFKNAFDESRQMRAEFDAGEPSAADDEHDDEEPPATAGGINVPTAPKPATPPVRRVHAARTVQSNVKRTPRKTDDKGT